jgi:dienelactone hydrolase
VLALAAVLALAVLVAGCGGGGARAAPRVSSPSPPPTTTTTTTTTRTASRRPRPATPRPPFAVGELTLTFVDHSRTVSYPGQAPTPRRLVTLVRYPEARGSFPLVVFGHGFAVTPGIYARLLASWARAGFVVAAPVFPLANANAPGGPNEADLVNQPRDMSFVITQLLALGAHHRTPFELAPREIAVAGQSDGGDTALSVAYNSRFRDRRVRAAVILSGQEIPGVGGYDFPAPSPPLLATQGLADTINLPATTFAFWDAAPAPKYLLTLPGAPHLGPYTDEQPQLGAVERVTVAFLERYLEGEAGPLARLLAAGGVPGVAVLRAETG